MIVVHYIDTVQGNNFAAEFSRRETVIPEGKYMFKVRHPVQILLAISSKFKRINHYFPRNHQKTIFCDFEGDRI